MRTVDVDKVGRHIPCQQRDQSVFRAADQRFDLVHLAGQRDVVAELLFEVLPQFGSVFDAALEGVQAIEPAVPVQQQVIQHPAGGSTFIGADFDDDGGFVDFPGDGLEQCRPVGCALVEPVRREPAGRVITGHDLLVPCCSSSLRRNFAAILAGALLRRVQQILCGSRRRAPSVPAA